MWTPEILKTEEDPNSIWVSAPFEMPRASGALVGRTLTVRGAPHKVEIMTADARPTDEPIREGERILLKVRPLAPT